MLFDTRTVLWLLGFASPALTAVMNAISMAGYTPVYMAIGVTLAVLVRLRAGAALLLLLALNSVLTDTAKVIVRAPRPGAVDSRVRTLGVTDTVTHPPGRDFSLLADGLPDSYAFPSGHVSAATVFLIGLMQLFGWPWVWKLMAGWIPAMALSRMYLGRHFPGDVLGGLGFGVLTAAIGLFALSLARLSDPARARNAAVRPLAAAVALAAYALIIQSPVAYDAGRFMGLAIGAAYVVSYLGRRFDPVQDIPMVARFGGLALAAIVFGVSWWTTRLMLAATDITGTAAGALLLGGLPTLFVLPLPLYLLDHFFVPRAPRVET
jgi:membrane-associated phospholipid phosphatase